MTGSGGILAPIAAELEALESRLSAELDGDAPAIAALVRPTVVGPGKRLRPALLFLVASFGDPDAEAVLAAAAGVELIHAATLIHDDLIDASPTRRGVAAVHTVAGPAGAILAGDHYLAKGLGLVARSAGGAIAARVADEVMAICAGEFRQMNARLDIERSIDDYLAAIAGKTAGLFQVCCAAGAAVGGLESSDTAAAERFGWDLGMAFQIADDLLDYSADALAMGKPVAADLREGTVTLPLMLALADPASGPPLRQLLDAPDIGDRNYAEVVTLVRASSGMAAAAARAAAYVAEAHAALQSLPAAPARETLGALADFVVTRST